MSEPLTETEIIVDSVRAQVREIESVAGRK
jgi:hypothetical protein